jgi:surface polysaccharide O-acyltransferase-like enzyme
MLGLALITPAAADRSRQRVALAFSILAVICLQVVNFTLRNVANAQPELAPLLYVGPLAPLAIVMVIMLVGRRRVPRLPAPAPIVAGLAAR